MYNTRFVFLVLLAEWLVFIFSGVSFAQLHGDTFFSLDADPVSVAIFSTGIPQFILHHQWIGILLDISITILLMLFIRDTSNNRIAIALFILLLLFYVTV